MNERQFIQTLRNKGRRRTLTRFKAPEHGLTALSRKAVRYAKLLEAWAVVAGPLIARHTAIDKVGDNSLTIAVDSAVLLARLNQRRHKLMKEMQEVDPRVRKIVFIPKVAL